MFLFVAIFVVVIGGIVFSIGKGVVEWSSNNTQPVLTVKSKVIAKRADVSVSSSCHDTGNNINHHHSTSSSTSYYATFEFTSGDRKEFEVSESQYGLLVESDVGDLTFQGTRYKGFQREMLGRELASSSVDSETKSDMEGCGPAPEQRSEHSFCPYCGVQVEGSFKFCPHCGKEQPLYTSQV